MAAEPILIQTLNTLNKITATLNQAENTAEALQSALTQLIDLMGLKTGWLFLRDPEAQGRWAGRGFILAAHHNLPPALALKNPAPWNKGCACQTLCQEGQLNMAYNEVHCSRLSEASGERRGLTVHASAPLRSKQQILGILNVAAPNWEAFTPEKLALLTNAGLQMGVFLDRARLFDLMHEQRIDEQLALLNLSRQLLSLSNLPDLLHYLVDEVCQLLAVDACAILLVSGEEDFLCFQAASGWVSDPVGNAYRVPVAGTGSGQVLQSQQPLLWNGPEEIPLMSQSPMLSWLRQEGFQSAAIVPLVAYGRSIGTLVVDTRSTRIFEEGEIRFLQLMANQAAIAIEKARLREEELARHRIERELAVGRQIQLSMLPQSSLSVPGWQFAVEYEPARQVGGDFYDYFFVPGQENLLGVVIADVSDKGVPAALFMALSRTTIRNTALRGRPPAEALTWANRFVLEDSVSDMFLSAFYATLDVSNGRFTYANAGHNHPLWWQAATQIFTPLKAAGAVLGVMAEVELEQCTIDLAPGDAVVLYTDGVTEAMNDDLQEFGAERLETAVAHVLRQDPQATAADMATAVLKAVSAFIGDASQHDDFTLLIMRRDPAP